MLGPSFDLGHIASQQSGQLYFSLLIINIVIFVAACCACHHAAGPGGICSESPVHHLLLGSSILSCFVLITALC